MTAISTSASASSKYVSVNKASTGDSTASTSTSLESVDTKAVTSNKKDLPAPTSTDGSVVPASTAAEEDVNYSPVDIDNAKLLKAELARRI